MSGITYDYMEQYIRSLIENNSEELKQLEDYAIKNSVPIVHKEVRKFLEVMINIKKPKTILELGTAIGYSSILMCKASGNISRIDTIERDLNMVKISKDNIKLYGYDSNINVINGECLEVLKKLQGKYDMIFIDAGKAHYNHFLPECLRLLDDNGIIIADNVLFRGMVASKELVIRRKITIVKRMKNFLEQVSKSKQLMTSVIPMGDGIAVITRRKNNE